jgi:hypothetical protein
MSLMVFETTADNPSEEYIASMPVHTKSIDRNIIVENAINKNAGEAYSNTTSKIVSLAKSDIAAGPTNAVSMSKPKNMSKLMRTEKIRDVNSVKFINLSSSMWHKLD